VPISITGDAHAEVVKSCFDQDVASADRGLVARRQEGRIRLGDRQVRPGSSPIRLRRKALARLVLRKGAGSTRR
jgi:hypothetical protein